MNTAKKRILHITHDMGVGGAEQVIRHIILANNAAKFDTEIVCIDGKVGATGEALRKSGVQITAFSRQAGLDRKTIAFKLYTVINILHSVTVFWLQ